MSSGYHRNFLKAVLFTATKLRKVPVGSHLRNLCCYTGLFIAVGYVSYKRIMSENGFVTKRRIYFVMDSLFRVFPELVRPRSRCGVHNIHKEQASLEEYHHLLKQRKSNPDRFYAYMRM